MGSAIPKADVSTTWRPHHCGATHPTSAPCPRLGYWLVSGQKVDGGRPSTVTPILHAPSRRGA